MGGMQEIERTERIENMEMQTQSIPSRHDAHESAQDVVICHNTYADNEHSNEQHDDDTDTETLKTPLECTHGIESVSDSSYYVLW